MIALCGFDADVKSESCSGKYKFFIAFCTFAIDIKSESCSRKYEVVIALCGFAADDRSESCSRKYEIVIALCRFAADVRSVLAVANIHVAGCVAQKKPGRFVQIQGSAVFDVMGRGIYEYAAAVRKSLTSNAPGRFHNYNACNTCRAQKRERQF